MFRSQPLNKLPLSATGMPQDSTSEAVSQDSSVERRAAPAQLTQSRWNAFGSLAALFAPKSKAPPVFHGVPGPNSTLNLPSGLQLHIDDRAPLGEGVSGKVYRARDVVGHRDVAVKVIHIPEDSGMRSDEQHARRSKDIANIRQEIANAWKCRDVPYILPLLDARMEKVGKNGLVAILVYPLAEGGNLLDYSKQYPESKFCIPESVVRARFLEAAMALEGCHARGIIHRDVSFMNFMFTETGLEASMKLIDFGLSHDCGTRFVDLPTSSCGNPAYAAPELLPGQSNGDREYGPETDVWSLGICIYAALKGRLPWNGMPADDETSWQPYWKNVLAEVPYDLSGISAPMCQLIARMLSHEPARRPTMAQVVQQLQIMSCDGTRVLASLDPDEDLGGMQMSCVIQ